MTVSRWYQGNSMVVQVSNLRDHTGALVTGATVRVMTVKHADGTNVAGVATPLTLDEISPGFYQGGLPSNAGVTSGEVVNLTVEATTDDNLDLLAEERAIVEVRRA